MCCVLKIMAAEDENEDEDEEFKHNIVAKREMKKQARIEFKTTYGLEINSFETKFDVTKKYKQEWVYV